MGLQTNIGFNEITNVTPFLYLKNLFYKNYEPRNRQKSIFVIDGYL